MTLALTRPKTQEGKTLALCGQTNPKLSFLVWYLSLHPVFTHENDLQALTGYGRHHIKDLWVNYRKPLRDPQTAHFRMLTN